MHPRYLIRSCLKALLRPNSYLSNLATSVGCRLQSHETKLSSPPGLMHFFDEKTNWGKTLIRVGRAWTVDDLRIKSNEDLHKLWYVLLKERNMLLTMQHHYEVTMVECFPNPERIDKVEESMENLEVVVMERDKAYYQLEVSREEDGAVGVRRGRDELGRMVDRELVEHAVPESEETELKGRDPRTDEDVAQFLAILEETESRKKRREKYAQQRHVCGILRNFPDTNVDLLKQQYPLLDIDKLRKRRISRGNRENLF